MHCAVIISNIRDRGVAPLCCLNSNQTVEDLPICIYIAIIIRNNRTPQIIYASLILCKQIPPKVFKMT